MGFVLSFILVCLSSFMLGSSLREKKLTNFFIYTILILLSQVIFSFEILSLLQSINPKGVLACNVIFFTIASAIWLRKGKPVQDFSPIKPNINLIQNALKSDKMLLILSILFCFCTLITLFFVIFVPTNNMDALTYKLGRVAFWIQNGSLEHFPTPSIRQVIFPINFELILLWSMVFLKRDYLTIFPAFLSYLGCLGVISAYLKNMKLSLKRILWIVLILGSIPIMIVEASSLQSDIFIGFLLASSFYLYWDSVRRKEFLPVAFSALAYAIALGAKSTAIFFIPIFAILFIIIAKKEKNYKPLFNFVLCVIAAFLILSAFNYALNFLNYGNIFGPYAAIHQHLTPGLKYFTPSLMLYMFHFADFSGIDIVNKNNPDILAGITSLLNTIGYKLTDCINMGKFNGLNYRIHENFSNFGLLGYLLIFPMITYALAKLKGNRGKSFYISLCGIFIPAILVIITCIMGFSVWFTRFMIPAIILASPILAFSYTRKSGPYKILITTIVAVNYLLIPTYNIQKPFFPVIKHMSISNDFNELRNDLRLMAGSNLEIKYDEYLLIKYVSENIPDNSKIGLVYSDYDAIYPFFEANPTWKIYMVRYEQLIENKDFDNYDYLIFAGKKQNQCPLEQKVEYNYYPDYKAKTVRFKEKCDNVVKTFYANRKNQIIFKGSPIKMATIFEEKHFSDYFKHVKTISAKKTNLTKSGLFKIYKKL